MKNILLIICFIFFFTNAVFAADKRPWVYFDLGDTIVSTKDIKHLKYMNGAREYMEELKREGFKIGIISNIPESWGMDYDEKFQSLKKMIADGWDEERPFDWSIYDDVILPLKNSERKPAPTLFIEAINKAQSCPSVYIGESVDEITAAGNAGMATKLYNKDDSVLYVPVDQMKMYIIQNYKLDYDKNCI